MSNLWLLFSGTWRAGCEVWHRSKSYNGNSDPRVSYRGNVKDVCSSVACRFLFLWTMMPRCHHIMRHATAWHDKTLYGRRPDKISQSHVSCLICPSSGAMIKKNVHFDTIQDAGKVCRPEVIAL